VCAPECWACGHAAGHVCSRTGPTRRSAPTIGECGLAFPSVICFVINTSASVRLALAPDETLQNAALVCHCKYPAVSAPIETLLMAMTPRPSLSMAERLFSPENKIWEVDRELALLLSGGRALLMQLAHPKIAAGVAEHSNFRDDPLGRLYRTMSAMWSIVFDEAAPAREALERINNVHGRVHGIVPAAEPSYGGMAYDAFDQALLLWVHATLIDSALVAYELFVKPLRPEEKARYYADSKKLARVFEISDRLIPASLKAFTAYMEWMLGGPGIAVGPTAQSLARDILYPKPWLLRPAGPVFRLITAGLLPERLRRDYKIAWNQRRHKTFRLAVAGIRHLLPLVPRPLRIVANARRAERQLRPKT